MKKLSFFLMAMLFSVMSFAATETISCPAGTVVSSKITMDFKSLTFLQEQGSSTSAVKAYSPWRIYKNHKVTFTPQTDVTIENLVITCTGSDYAKNGTLTNATATLSGTTLTITPTDGTQAFTFAATEAQVRWQKIVVTYKVAGEVVAVEAPKFDVTTSNFTEAFSLNITSAEGTTLKYTTDTTDPATSATAVVINTNTATVAIPAKSTMVRAIAIKGEDVSEEKETTYCYVNSPATAYTVAEAMEVIDAGLGLTNELYVKGEISTIEKYDANYGSITYWIKDEEGNKFECYSGLGLNKAKFTKKEDLVVGSKVVVCGVMKKYNTTYEFNYNNYIVSLELPVAKYNVTVTAENGTVEGAGEYEENAEVTLTATPAEGYEFTCWTSGEDTVSTANPYTFAVTANLALVANFNKKAEPEHTYTVAGSSATVFGEPWKAENADNDMTKQEDGTYKLEKTELTLAAGTIEFKVCQDHAWTVAYPGDNYKLTIAEDGIYTITITFNPADKAVAATATKTGDAGKIIPVIAMHGNFLGEWADTENFTLAADEATATLTLTIAEGNYEFGVRIDGTWTSNGVAFTRENASAEIVAGSGNLKLAADVAGNYTFTWTYATNTLTITYPSLPVAMVGNVKRALQMGENVVVLTHEADGTAHIYNVVEGLAYEVSQEGVVAVDPEDEYDYLAISDIATTEDGKLVATNYTRCNFGSTTYGTSYFYLWNDLDADPTIWFKSNASSNSTYSDQGYTMAVKGTSTNAVVMTTGVHNNKRGVRMSQYTIIDGVYEDINNAGGFKTSDYYFLFGLTDNVVFNEAISGTNLELAALGENWVMDGNLIEPTEWAVPATMSENHIVQGVIAEGTLGKKYNGATYVTVDGQVLMVAPYADAEGKLAGMKVLDVTDGFATATEVGVINLDAAVEAAAAATAVAVEGKELNITLVADATLYQKTFTVPAKPIKMVGVVKRAIQYYDATIILTHEADGTAHIYNVVDGVVAEVSQEGVIANDPENAGDLLALSDIALTEDGKLVAVNYAVCQVDSSYIDEGYKRGENRFYIWNSLEEAPVVWFKSNMYGNWNRGKQGYSMAIKGTSTNAEIAITSIHPTSYWSRFACYKVIEGVYTEPADAAAGNDNYYWFEGPLSGDLDENICGAAYELNASPLAATNWIIDAELIDPIEYVYVDSLKNTFNVNPELNKLSVDLGKKFNGATYMTVNSEVFMVAPYADAEGKLAGVKVLDITNGLAVATEVGVANLDAAIEAAGAATAVSVVDDGFAVNLVADATIYPLFVGVEFAPQVIEFPLEITNLTTSEMPVGEVNYLQLNGSNDMEGVELMLFIPNYTREDKEYALDLANSYLTFGGIEMTLVEGALTKSTDPEKGDVFTGRIVASAEEEGETYMFAFNLTMYALPATVLEITDATVTFNEDLGTLTFEATLEDGKYMVELSNFNEPGIHEGPQICLLETPAAIAYANYAETFINNGIITLTCEEFVSFNGGTFEVTISGKVPEGPLTGLDNVEVNAKLVKMIKNGMLIINKDGREFNAQGAIVK